MPEEPELVLDQQLINELLHPGSDQRSGVNIVARPSISVLDQISALQNQLRVIEPKQYYYPGSDLHLTVLEICSGTESAHADRVLNEVLAVAPAILSQLPSPILRQASARVDGHAGVVVFQDSGTLSDLRQCLSSRLAARGVSVSPRYASASAHITFMRFINQLAGRWEQLVNFSNLHGSWQPDELWVTSGATWYGMKSRIKEIGPFKLYYA